VTVARVVDASALAALLFGEPEADDVARWIEDSRLLAPHLLDFELASVCWKKCRRDPDRTAHFTASFALGLRLPIERTGVDHSEALELALATGLTAYDASYLWLSRSLGAELVTLDRELAHAAAKLAT